MRAIGSTACTIVWSSLFESSRQLSADSIDIVASQLLCQSYHAWSWYSGLQIPSESSSSTKSAREPHPRLWISIMLMPRVQAPVDVWKLQPNSALSSVLFPDDCTPAMLTTCSLAGRSSRRSSSSPALFITFRSHRVCTRPASPLTSSITPPSHSARATRAGASGYLSGFSSYRRPSSRQMCSVLVWASLSSLRASFHAQRSSSRSSSEAAS
mmetsp:Transcript_65138/g.153824  ORF Transcript_65138/g.153824 Transcript_65138/m.153824 type:complete len:212 (-) Transcript_65138:1193-1828(-)